VDWYQAAKNDWEVYKDPSRIKKYVQFNKITPEQYEQLTGQTYATA
jgi:hypothetical protein